MYDQAQLIEKLGIQSWPEEKQEKALEIATLRIGTAITDELSEQQFNEYKAIIEDDHSVIEAWLEQHMPDYKTSPVYQEIEAEHVNDPSKNNPAKMFASIAWVEKNVPDIQAKVDAALEAFRAELARV